MIPETALENTPEVMEDIEVVRQPSYGYGVDFETKKITGFVDNTEAVKQAIYLILSTERYKEPIYPWTYGFEKLDLYGENPYLVTPKLQQRVFDALYQDDRITDIADFKAENVKGIYTLTFTVSTIFGEDIDMEVSI